MKPFVIILIEVVRYTVKIESFKSSISYKNVHHLNKKSLPLLRFTALLMLK